MSRTATTATMQHPPQYIAIHIRVCNCAITPIRGVVSCLIEAIVDRLLVATGRNATLEHLPEPCGGRYATTLWKVWKWCKSNWIGGRHRSEARAEEEAVAWRRGEDEVASKQEEWIEREREKKEEKKNEVPSG